MKRSRFIKDQIIGILKEHEAGVSLADLCRNHGISDATVYKLKAKNDGMDGLVVARLLRSSTRFHGDCLETQWLAL
jgi:putative transposase